MSSWLACITGTWVFAGDGLRGPGYYPTTTYVPFRPVPADAQATHWSGPRDAPGAVDGNQLIDVRASTNRFFFMEVDVRPKADTTNEVVMTPLYAFFPLMNTQGVATGEFDFRQTTRGCASMLNAEYLGPPARAAFSKSPKLALNADRRRLLNAESAAANS